MLCPSCWATLFPTFQHPGDCGKGVGGRFVQREQRCLWLLSALTGEAECSGHAAAAVPRRAPAPLPARSSGQPRYLRHGAASAGALPAVPGTAGLGALLPGPGPGRGLETSLQPKNRQGKKRRMSRGVFKWLCRITWQESFSWCSSPILE